MSCTLHQITQRHRTIQHPVQHTLPVRQAQPANVHVPGQTFRGLERCRSHQKAYKIVPVMGKSTVQSGLQPHYGLARIPIK